MGCDIHMFAEKKVDDRWVKVGNEFHHKTYGGDTYFNDEPYEGRNYELFALLADVRNDSGILPVSSPKGWPTDISRGGEEVKEYWDDDGHSASYYTLKELKDAVTNGLTEQIIYDRAVVTSKDDDGNITSTARWTNGEHLGEVGERRLFKLFKDEKNPIETIISLLDGVLDEGADDDIRIVFCFDN